MNLSYAYLYKMTHLPTMRWYIGSHCNKKSGHYLDSYLCSSKVVKRLVEANPDEWRRDILAVSTDHEEMYELETEILQLFDAAGDPRSFNQHNNTGSFGTHGTEPWNKGLSGYSTSKRGKKCGSWSDDAKARQAPRVGKANAMFGKTHTEAAKAKMAEAERPPIKASTKAKHRAHIVERYKDPAEIEAQSLRMKQWWANRKEKKNA